MKKIGLLVLSLLALASCGKEYENHYTLKRLSSIEQSNADGSSKRVGTYTYYEDGFSIKTTLDGTPESLTRVRYTANLEIQADSIYVAGALQPESITTSYYRDGYRNILDSLITVDPAGVETYREDYEYDMNSYVLIITENGAQTTKKQVHNFYNTVSAEIYTIDEETGGWKYDRKEETVPSYDEDITTVTLYVNGKAAEKSVYQNQPEVIKFMRYISEDGIAWTLTATGMYVYETVTI